MIEMLRDPNEMTVREMIVRQEMLKRYCDEVKAGREPYVMALWFK